MGTPIIRLHYLVTGKHDMSAIPPQEVVKDYKQADKEWYHLTVSDGGSSNLVVSLKLKWCAFCTCHSMYVLL